VVLLPPLQWLLDGVTAVASATRFAKGRRDKARKVSCGMLVRAMFPPE
jgi:hypothetical protein